MQWAIDYQGGTNWYEVQEWTDPGWNDVPLDEDDAIMSPTCCRLKPDRQADSVHPRLDQVADPGQRGQVLRRWRLSARAGPVKNKKSRWSSLQW